MIKKLNTLCRGHMLLRRLFTKKYCKKKKFRIEKLVKRKSDKLYVKYKGYNNSFNSWIDKKRQYK